MHINALHMFVQRDFCSGTTAQAQVMTVCSLGLCHQPATPVLVSQQGWGPQKALLNG